MNLSLSVLALLLLPAVAAAQEMEAPQNCPAAAAPLPATLSDWTSKTDLAAASGPSGLDGATLAPGKAVSVTLRHTREVQYVTQPEKPGGSVAYGGLLLLQIKSAGTYQVNLNSGAWIDLLKEGISVVSSGHAPGPACWGIRKTVQFALQPGRYVIQLSANADPTIGLMVSRVP